MQEENCQFVTSRGIARSCDVFPSRLVSDSLELNIEDYRDIRQNSTVYVIATQLELFFELVLPTVRVPFVLVTGDADRVLPGETIETRTVCQALLDDDRIIHWFAQNMALQHPKITQIPIGLDYHTRQGEGFKGQDHGRGPNRSAEEQESALTAIRDCLEPIERRPPTTYVNFLFSPNKERARARRALKYKPFVVYERQHVSTEATWKNQGACSFVISPPGNGADCHRTWEALVLGCVPVVTQNFLEHLYRDLPVMIVRSWREVTASSLERFKTGMEHTTYAWDKLRLEYWRTCFRERAMCSSHV